MMNDESFFAPAFERLDVRNQEVECLSFIIGHSLLDIGYSVFSGFLVFGLF
jgi:hypothetical protein